MIDGTRSWNRIVAAAAPLMLAIVEMFHPHPHDLLNLDLTRWMAAHYAQLALFPLAALVECILVGGRGLGANICRVAMFVFAVSYVAFDTAAGVVTGVLVHSARTTGAPEAWRAPIMAVWDHAVIGGKSDAAPVLAVIGTAAWLVGGGCPRRSYFVCGSALAANRGVDRVRVRRMGRVSELVAAGTGGPRKTMKIVDLVRMMGRERRDRDKPWSHRGRATV